MVWELLLLLLLGMIQAEADGVEAGDEVVVALEDEAGEEVGVGLAVGAVGEGMEVVMPIVVVGTEVVVHTEEGAMLLSSVEEKTIPRLKDTETDKGTTMDKGMAMDTNTEDKTILGTTPTPPLLHLPAEG
jgi:hypothetical protein